MAKAAKPIPLAALMEKVQSGAITEKEVKSYFRISSDRSRPFGPTMAINEDTVAIAGMEGTARAIGPSLGYEASKVAQTNKLVAAGAPAPDGSIIAEGDSWFNLPSLYPRTMVDFLQETLPIINLAQWGDELEEMMLTGEYIRYLERGSVKYFLFSGGGNDVLGGGTLTAFLKLYNSLYNGPEYASYYVKKAFYDNLDVVEGLYRKLIENVRTDLAEDDPRDPRIRLRDPARERPLARRADGRAGTAPRRQEGDLRRDHQADARPVRQSPGAHRLRVPQRAARQDARRGEGQRMVRRVAPQGGRRQAHGR